MRMKISLILLAVAVVASGVVFFLIQQEEQPVSSQQTESSRATPQSESFNESEAEAPEEVSGTGSFAELLTRGQSLRCDIQVNDPEMGPTTGVTYIDGGAERMRSDVDMQADGMAVEASTIVKDDMMYTWSSGDMGEFAIKMTLSDDTSDAPTPDTAEQSAVSMDQDVEYTCAPWSVEESMFTLPSGVEFQSMDQMMQMPEGMELPENMPQM